MPLEQTDRLPITFLDVAARFSEEEWKLLHEWQKELFKNVMKEIHQALVSLGPLIATSVFSLRAEEKDVDRSDTEDARRQHISYPPTSNMNSNSGVSLGRNPAKCQNPLRPPDKGRREICPFLSTEDEAVIIIKDEGDGDSENHQDMESSEYTIKRAGDQLDKQLFSRCPANTEELQFLEVSRSAGWSTGNGRGSRRGRETDKLQCAEASITSNAAPGKTKVNVPCSFEERIPLGGQLWSEINRNLEGEKYVQSETELTNPTCPSLKTGFYKPETNDQLNENESNLRNEMPFTGHKKTNHNWPQYKCNECDKIFKCSMDRIRHMRTHTVDRPFQCSECNKRFRQSGALHRHERIHTGERPFHCAMCPKSFNQKENLISHQRTHTGEKPHQCSVCNKRFSLKGNLIQHMRNHTGERPFQCNECDKSFSKKSNLTKHQITHT